MDSKAILEKAKAYRDYTAHNLSEMIKVPGFSCTEKDRIELLKKMCKEAGMSKVLWRAFDSGRAMYKSKLADPAGVTAGTLLARKRAPVLQRLAIELS